MHAPGWNFAAPNRSSRDHLTYRVHLEAIEEDECCTSNLSETAKVRLDYVTACPGIGDEINFDSRGEAAQAHTPKP